MCTISCKVDEKVKSDAEAIFDSLGISMSTAINMFLRATIREEGLPISTKLKSGEQLIQENVEDQQGF